jgi:hypothetical protein
VTTGYGGERLDLRAKHVTGDWGKIGNEDTLKFFLSAYSVARTIIIKRKEMVATCNMQWRNTKSMQEFNQKT